MNFHLETYPTPVGDFSVAFDSAGAVVATAFGSAATLKRRMENCHLIGDNPLGGAGEIQGSRGGTAGTRQRTAMPGGTGRLRTEAKVAAVALREQLQEYFAGTRRGFEVELAARGTAFQRRVWKELRRIPFGETRTYRQIAAAIGSPLASRAVGGANAMNPICLIVPCHRVIGSDGSLTGFAFGTEIKRALLDHEARGGGAIAAA